MQRIFLLLTALLFSTAALFATPTQLPEGKWRLTGYNFRPKIAFPNDKMNVTLTIDGQRLGGRSGCNVYGGEYGLKDGKLHIGGLISTMMACDGPEMQFERLYTETLQKATEFSTAGGELTITDPKMLSFLRFKKIDEKKVN